MPNSVKETRSQSLQETVQWSRDGVRSWLVCLAALYVYAATWGTSASSARALLLSRLEHFFKYSNENESAASTEDALALVHKKTAAVYSVHNGFAHLMTLPATFLVHHVGCRLTLLVGFALSSAGSAVAALWPHSSLWVWWMGFGAATGAGNALVYIASLVVVEQAFDRHFGAASALVCLGSTFTFVFLPYIWSALLGLGAASDEEKLESTEMGLSFIMFHLCLNVLVCIPMLPLFGSPFFIAVRQLQFRLTSIASNTSSPSDSISSTTSMTKNLEDGGNYCKRVFFKLFDFPTPGYKYLGSKSLTIECIVDNSSNNWSYQLRLVWRTVSERNFFLFIVAYALFSLFNAVPDTYLESSADELFPDKVSTLMLNSYGLGQILGKVVAAPLLDMFPSLFGRTLVVANGTNCICVFLNNFSKHFHELNGSFNTQNSCFVAGIILKGLVTGAVPVSMRTLPRLEVLMALYASQGVCDGLHFGGHSALIHSLVGSERYAIGLSISALVSTPAVLAGSQLDGLARDLLKEYCMFTEQ